MVNFQGKFMYAIIVAIAAIIIVMVFVWINRSGQSKTKALETNINKPIEQKKAVETNDGKTGESKKTVSESTASQGDLYGSNDQSTADDEYKKSSVEDDIPSVAETYMNYFLIGAAIEPDQTTGLTGDLLKKHVNMLVAENVMKPESIQPTEGNFQWDQADKIVKFAKDNGMELRFHTLVWHNQTPNWFFMDEEGKPMADETDPKKREANKNLLLKRLETHVCTIVERYKNDIKSWDVVNEVIEPADPDGMRNSLWYQITGTEYIETAFLAARKAGGPDIKLYINDYGTDDPVKRDLLYKLVKELLDKGVPIDGVGHQTHINIYWPLVNRIIESMQKFHELGLDNIITELDMSIYAWNDRSDYGDDIPEHVIKNQAQRYKELFKALKENNDILSAVVFWGISDGHTWLNSFPVKRTDAPLLFDKYFHAKPAYWGVVDPSRIP